MLKKWEELPLEMQTEEVRYYYYILCKKKLSLVIKRLFDIFISAIMLAVLSFNLMGDGLRDALDPKLKN